MEKQPTERQREGWPTDVGAPKGSGKPTPPWLWLVTIGLLALIFRHFVPVAEVQASYAPWFLQQVDADNIESRSIQGLEVRGVLRQVQVYQRPTSGAPMPAKKFYTYFPSEASIEPIVQKLTGPRTQGSTPVQIEANPPNPNVTVRIMLLMPMFVVLGLIYLMMRRARDRFDRSEDYPPELLEDVRYNYFGAVVEWRSRTASCRWADAFYSSCRDW